jgi:aquaporin Z
MNAYIAEFLGTFLLVFVIFVTGNYLAIGAALAIGVMLAGPISGGSLNPAVTLALLSAGKLSVSQVVPYILAEVAGALAAYQTYKLFWNKK